MALRLSIGLFLILSFSVVAHAEEETFDLVIYGGSPAGLVAATAAARENPEMSIAVIEPSAWIGGVVSGGLSRTDKGNEKTIGGITREYFERARSLGGEDTPMWYAEPKYNAAAFREILKAHEGIAVSTGRRVISVAKEGARIVSVKLDDGSRISGRIFIDASYEGDLMARAGVSYIVGRESRDTYGEDLAGYTPMPVRPHGPETMGAVCSCLGGDAPHFIHGTPAVINALDENGEAIAGVVKADPKIKPGDGDGLTQSYNFRLCVTQRKDILVPFPKPENYDSARYELLLRLIERYPEVRFGRLVHLGQIANGKCDLNAQGLFSTDYAGGNTGYSDGEYATRERIFQDHVDYVQGFLWFLGHDDRVPRSLRDDVNTWGLCSDEFADNDHWSYALYVREARRMMGQYVMKQSDTWTDIVKPDSIGMGSFILDCHIVQRIVTPDGNVADEGSFQDSPVRPYQIPWRSLLPKAEECENLLVPVCLSASHIAYCSIRMEPVYMAMGHACGVAAALAHGANGESPSFTDVKIDALQAKLRAQKAILELERQRVSAMEKQLREIAEIEARERAAGKKVAEEQRLASERARIATDEEIQSCIKKEEDGYCYIKANTKTGGSSISFNCAEIRGKIIIRIFRSYPRLNCKTTQFYIFLTFDPNLRVSELISFSNPNLRLYKIAHSD